MLVSNAKPQSTQVKADKRMSFGAIPFKAGFNEARHLIENTDIRRVVKQFQNIGIPTDFAGNKVVAACSGLTANIFMKLGLKPPTGIFVTDFKPLGLGDALAVCINSVPTGNEKIKLDRIVGKKTNIRNVLFDSNVNWSNIDETMDRFKLYNHTSTNSFLHPFIHEFSHNVHIDYLYTKYGCPQPNNLGYKTGSILDKIFKKDSTSFLNATFKTSPAPVRAMVSNYGATKPEEFVAEHMTDVITSFLDPKTCMPTVEPFRYSQIVNGKTVDKLFKKAWEGKLP